LSKNEKSVKT